MKRIIPYGRQFISKEDIKNVSKTLKKDIITSGSEIPKFEKEIQKYLKCKYSTVCNSGTSALFLSLLSIGLKKNDVVIMPSINFVASHNVSKILGAKIYLADVNKYNGQMSPDDVINVCKKFKIKKIKALIVMYNGGYPLNSEKFYNLKKKYKCYIIEDACHALGAEYRFKKNLFKIGSCKHSDISTFSLHPLKTITSGEGGIVTTNSKILDYKIKKFRSLGIKRSKEKHWDYDVELTGFNFRLTDFQCSLGLSQLKKIKNFLKKRKQIVKKYNLGLKKINQINIPIISKSYNSSNHLYLINIKRYNMKKKESFIRYMMKNRILTQQHYKPVYKFKSFKGKYVSRNAEIYYNSTVSLPIFYQLSSKEQNYIISKVNSFFKN
jgi:dTDP-4-amino-4,6-dideoxygalactose transaminase